MVVNAARVAKVVAPLQPLPTPVPVWSPPVVIQDPPEVPVAKLIFFRTFNEAVARSPAQTSRLKENTFKALANLSFIILSNTCVILPCLFYVKFGH